MGKIVQEVKVLATKTNGLSSIPRAQAVEKDSWKLFSDLQVFVHTNTLMHTQTGSDT